jgi:hypothetical protein
MSTRFCFQIDNVDPEFFRVSLVTQNSRLQILNLKPKMISMYISCSLVYFSYCLSIRAIHSLYRSFCLARYLSIMPHDMEP